MSSYTYQKFHLGGGADLWLWGHAPPPLELHLLIPFSKLYQNYDYRLVVKRASELYYCTVLYTTVLHSDMHPHVSKLLQLHSSIMFQVYFMFLKPVFLQPA